MPLTKLNATLGLTGTLPAVSGANLTGISAGKVLQVVTATDGTERNSTSTSYVTASNSLSVNITPSSSSNKVYIVVSTSAYSQVQAKAVYVTLYRDSTNIGNSNGLCRQLALDSRSGSSAAFAILDSPNTTSQITYQVYAKTDSSGHFYLNANTPGSITAFEIEG
mgnify:CR=1 FL=1